MTNITRLVTPIMHHFKIPAPQVPTVETLKNPNLTFGDVAGEVLVTYSPETDPANSWSSLVGRFPPESGRSLPLKFSEVNNRKRLRIQPIDATHWLNRSAGVSKFNVSLGLSLSRLATAFNLF